MSAEPRNYDPHLAATVMFVRLLLEDAAFARALDEFAADVLEKVPALYDEHMAHLIETGEAFGRVIEPEELVSVVVGWILGTPAGRIPAGPARERVLHEHAVIMSVVSWWSVNNAARVWEDEP